MSWISQHVGKSVHLPHRCLDYFRSLRSLRSLDLTIRRRWLCRGESCWIRKLVVCDRDLHYRLLRMSSPTPSHHLYPNLHRHYQWPPFKASPGANRCTMNQSADHAAIKQATKNGGSPPSWSRLRVPIAGSPRHSLVATKKGATYPILPAPWTSCT